MKNKKMFAVALTAIATLTLSAAQGVFDFETIPTGGNAPVSDASGNAAGWSDYEGGVYSSSSKDGKNTGHLNTSGMWFGGFISNSKTNTGTTYLGDADTQKGGASSGNNYGVIYGSAYGTLDAADKYFPNGYKTQAGTEYDLYSSFIVDSPVQFTSVDISMTAYTYTALMNPNGDTNVGTSGFDEDNNPVYSSISNTEGSYFACRIYALNESFEVVDTDKYEQFIFAQNVDGTVIVNEGWNTIDLSSICSEASGGLLFQLVSSFGNKYGILSPAYVAIDNLTYSTIPEPATFAAAFGAIALAFAAYRRRK